MSDPKSQTNSIQVLVLPEQAMDSALIDAVLKSPQPTLLKQQIIALIAKLWKEFQSVEQAIFAVLKTLENTKRLESELIALQNQSPTAEKNAERNAEMLQARLAEIQAEINVLRDSLTKEVTKYKSLSELRDAILAKDPSQGFYETLGTQTEANVVAGATQMLANMSPTLTKALNDKGITSEQLIQEITINIVQPKETVVQIEKRVANSTEQYNKDAAEYNKTQPANKQKELFTDTRTLRDIMTHHGFLYELQMRFALRKVLEQHLGTLPASERNKLTKDFFSGIDMHSHINRMEANIYAVAQVIIVEFHSVSAELNYSQQRIDNIQTKLDDLSNRIKGSLAQFTAATSDPLNSPFGLTPKPQPSGSKASDEELARSPFATPKLTPPRGGNAPAA